MEDREFERYFAQAETQLEHGAALAAVESLRSALGLDPNSPEAHALLSLALVQTKRLHAAEYEASVSLELEPLHPRGHIALGHVHLAARRPKKARQHLEQALELNPESAGTLLALSRVAQIVGNEKERKRYLDEALAIAPDEADALCAAGEYHLQHGDQHKAEELARAVLESSPENVDGLVLMGQIHLVRGNVEDAREHALWALRSSASDHGALSLMAAIKARESFVLGLWWRASVWLSARGETRMILILVVAFVLQRLAGYYADDNEMPMTSSIIGWVWLALCAYSWIGPGLFEAQLRKELAGVQLNDDF